MRRVLGVALLLLAMVCLAAGAGLALLLGPDNQVMSGPHSLSTKDAAAVTAPDALTWAGPTVTVLVTVPRHRPVFVGVGNAVDVADYLGRTAYLRVDAVHVPWRISTTSVRGTGHLPAAPTAVDWWLDQATGRGGAALTFPLPDQASSVAVIALGTGNLRGLEVTATYDLKGGFGIGLGLCAVAFGLGLFGWIAWRGRREWDDEDWDEDRDEDRDDGAGTTVDTPDDPARVTR